MGTFAETGVVVRVSDHSNSARLTRRDPDTPVTIPELTAITPVDEVGLLCASSQPSAPPAGSRRTRETARQMDVPSWTADTWDLIRPMRKQD